MFRTHLCNSCHGQRPAGAPPILSKDRSRESATSSGVRSSALSTLRTSYVPFIFAPLPLPERRPQPLSAVLSLEKRGGRHEELLRQLNETFHVRALDPTCADYLRARVGDGKAWPGPEWAPGQPHLEKRRGPGSPADSGNCCSGKGSVEGAHSVCGNGSAEHEVDAREIPVGTVGMELRGGEQLRGGLSPASDAVVGDEGGQGLQWSYEEKGLGKILSFVARRRGGETTPSTAGPL